MAAERGKGHGSKRSDVTSFLARKGFLFADDLDLGQLDKQFRRPFRLAETKPPVVHKKKKKPQWSALDGPTEQEEEDESLMARMQMTDAEREAETKKEEEKEAEAAKWAEEFDMGRSYGTNNAAYREAFMDSTRYIYSAVERQAQAQRRQLDESGMLDPAKNAVRAESLKRVHLAKQLRLDEMKRKSQRLIEMKGVLAKEGRMEDLPELLAKEEELRMHNRLSLRPSRLPAPTTTIKERRRAALDAHVKRQPPPPVDPHRHDSPRYSTSREGSPDSGRRGSRRNSTQLAGRAAASRKILLLGATTANAMSRERASDDDEVAIIPGAPTPRELAEVEEVFALKRGEIHARAQETLAALSKAAENRDKPANKAPKGAMPTDEDIAAAAGSEAPGAAGPSKAMQEKSKTKDLEEGQDGGAGPQGFAFTTRGEPLSAVRDHPKIVPPVFAPVQVLEQGAGESSPGKGPRQSPRSIAGGTRRTKYLKPDSPALALEEEEEDRGGDTGGKMAVPSRLNPSFASVPGPDQIVLQAADAKFTPRLGMFNREEDLKPVPDSFYHPDGEKLRKGTPDLEGKIGEEFNKVSTTMHVPNFLGEGDLLRLVPTKTQGIDSDLSLGPAPSDGQRTRKPKKTKTKSSVVVEKVPEPEVDQDEEDLTALAAELAQGVSDALSGGREISEGDAEIMKETADGQPPAPIDLGMAQRLEQIWTTLEMPMLDKLGMVVKYSDLGNVAKLEESLEAWADAVEAIQSREEILVKLATAKIRHRQQALGDHDLKGQQELAVLGDDISALEAQVTEVNRECNVYCDRLLNRYEDVATLRGMPYVEDLQCPLEQSLARVTALLNKR
mmetsp:Transcript_38464/g.90228  ORF Transcript_38464/g.90228 Transcript_38464/m.90228 type:complete len:841 (+) Transcript_38464:64-2586(+)